MNIEELDLNGGTFKATFPYHWIGWIVWVVGLLITLFGFMLALSDTVALIDVSNWFSSNVNGNTRLATRQPPQD